MLVADEFYFVSHDEANGKPLLHIRIAGLGLAAALLGELILDGHINVSEGNLAVVNPRPPEDALEHIVLDQLLSEPQHREVGIWLAFLGKTALSDGKGVMVDVSYKKGSDYLPDDAEVEKLRPKD